MLGTDTFWKAYTKMRCIRCGKQMKPMKGMKFNNYKIDGWKCGCGEAYYNPEQAQKISLIRGRYR